MIIYKPGQDITTTTAAFIINPISNDRDKDSFHFLANHKLYQEFSSKTNPKGGDVLWYRPKQKEILKGDRGIINVYIKEGQVRNWSIAFKKIAKQLQEAYSQGLYPAPLLAIPVVGLDESEVLRVITQSLGECKFDVEIYTSKLPISSEPIEEVSESAE
jgi:hypothetical protein